MTGYARYVGRVGALAVALGLGLGMAIADGYGMGVAYADEGTGTNENTAANTSFGENAAVPGGATPDDPVSTGTVVGGAGLNDEDSVEQDDEVSGDEDQLADDIGEDAAELGDLVDGDDTDEQDLSEATATPDPIASDVVPTSLQSTPAPASPSPSDHSTPGAPQTKTLLPGHQSSARNLSTMRQLEAQTTTTSIKSPTQTRLSFIPSGGREDLQPRAVSDPGFDAATIADTSPPPSTANGMLGAVLTIATNLASSLLSPFAAPSTTPPLESPLLWALLAWTRRETQSETIGITITSSTPEESTLGLDSVSYSTPEGVEPTLPEAGASALAASGTSVSRTTLGDLIAELESEVPGQWSATQTDILNEEIDGVPYVSHGYIWDETAPPDPSREVYILEVSYIYEETGLAGEHVTEVIPLPSGVNWERRIPLDQYVEEQLVGYVALDLPSGYFPDTLVGVDAPGEDPGDPGDPSDPSDPGEDPSDPSDPGEIDWESIENAWEDFAFWTGLIPVVGTVTNGISLGIDVAELFAVAGPRWLLGTGDVDEVVDEIGDLTSDAIGVVPVVGKPVGRVVGNAVEQVVGEGADWVIDQIDDWWRPWQ